MAQKLNHRVERLERVVNQDVLGADRRETIAAEILDPLRRARFVAREFEFGPLFAHQRRERRHAEHAVDDDDVARIGFDLAHDEGAQIFGHRCFDLQAHDIAEAALF